MRCIDGPQEEVAGYGLSDGLARLGPVEGVFDIVKQPYQQVFYEYDSEYVLNVKDPFNAFVKKATTMIKNWDSPQKYRSSDVHTTAIGGSIQISIYFLDVLLDSE